jgi:hypothetical protein
MPLISHQSNAHLPIHTYLPTSLSSLRSPVITAQSIPRSTVLQGIPRTRETAITLRSIHTARVELVATITLPPVLDPPVCISIAVHLAHLERHGRVIIKNRRAESSDVGRFRHAGVVRVIPDMRLDGRRRLRGFC